jgi:flagellar biosynthetic protein FlhB
MAEEEDSAEKEYEPTERKLQKARERGEVPKSTELTVAAAYGGVLIAGFGVGAAAFGAFGTSAMVLLDQADTLAPLFLGGHTGPVAGLLGEVLIAIAPWFVIPFLLVLATVFAQQAMVFAPEKIQPKLSRISPIATAKQKFGADGLFEFAKSSGKLIVISAILGIFLMSRLHEILETIYFTPGMIAVRLMELIAEFLFIVLVLAVVIGCVDFFYQRASHIRKNRMSRKEMMDEMKSSEGDPHMKAQRRQRAYDIATNRMLNDVPKADVVIVNPTHYAVALKWNRASGRAPICVAKGVDEIAARIREKAMEAGVPIHSDPPTARALHAAIDIGREIWPEHYRAVAAAIRFAEKMRARARSRMW